MKTTFNLYLILLLIPLSSFGQDFAQRVKEAYELNDKNYDLDCYYSRPGNFKLITATSSTHRSPNELGREFVIETASESVPMSFKIIRTAGNVSYRVLLNNTHLSQNTLRTRQFYIAPISDVNFAKKFETSKIYCSLNFAKETPVVLRDGNYHFSVHPHTIYDWQGRLKTPIESYLNNPQFESLIFLESNNERGLAVDLHAFFNNQETKLPASTLNSDLVNVPADTRLVVSPAGNNRFNLAANSELNITFSGGNHNYCIWNSARQVLMGLMKSKSSARVNFIYDSKAIVAQQKGMEGLSMNFNRRAINRSNLLADLLVPAVQANYHYSYALFFRNLFAKEYAGMYRTFKINYDAPGYSETFIMHGQGERDLEVNFNYL